jgi:hypothetical protein
MLLSRPDRELWAEEWADWTSNETTTWGRLRMTGNAAVDSVCRMVEPGRRFELVGQAVMWLSDDAHRVRQSDRWWWNRGGRLAAMVRAVSFIAAAWLVARHVDLGDAPFGWDWWKPVAGVVVFWWVAWSVNILVQEEVRDPERARLWALADELLVTSMAGCSRAEALEHAARVIDETDAAAPAEQLGWSKMGSRLAAVAGESRDQALAAIAERVRSVASRRETTLAARTVLVAAAAGVFGAARAVVGASVLAAALAWPLVGEWLIAHDAAGGTWVIVGAWFALIAARSLIGFAFRWAGDYFGFVVSVALAELVWLAGAGRVFADQALAGWRYEPLDLAGRAVGPVELFDWFVDLSPVGWVTDQGPVQGSWMSWLTGSSFPLWFDAVAVVVVLAVARTVVSRAMDAAGPRLLTAFRPILQLMEMSSGGDCVYCEGTGAKSLYGDEHCPRCLGTGRANRTPYPDWSPSSEWHKANCRRCHGAMTGACRPELHEPLTTTIPRTATP